MKSVGRLISVVLPCMAMLILILDTKTALQGAQMGLELCIYTVIPSLFPFFVISILLTNVLSRYKIPVLNPILRFCKMPEGAGNILIVGLLSGYPVGAKCIYDSWMLGQISKEDARRCLGFCSNAGPAFIFGMCGMLFTDKWVAWVLWGIHILSALLVGHLLPEAKSHSIGVPKEGYISLTEALGKAISAMAGVCGWVILFRVIIAFAQRWFLWSLPDIGAVSFEGFLELANGCTQLSAIQAEGIRFILCASFLGFGGLCVALQTISVTRELGTGMYFTGKTAQCAISCCLATLFASLKYRTCSPVLPSIITGILACFVLFKKTVAFPGKLVYNVRKDCKGRILCYSERKSQNPAAIVPGEQR